MEKLIRFGLTNISVSKPPFLEWKGGVWRVWLAYNSSLSSGTYVELYHDGLMLRVTIQNNKQIETAVIN